MPHAARSNAVHGDHLDHQAVLDAHHTHHMVMSMNQTPLGGSSHCLMQHVIIGAGTWGCQHGHHTYMHQALMLTSQSSNLFDGEAEFADAGGSRQSHAAGTSKCTV